MVIFLSGISFQLYLRNDKKFNDEYNYLKNTLEDLIDEIKRFDGHTPTDSAKKKRVDELLERNPRKFERGLKGGWKNTRDFIDDLKSLSEPSTRDTGVGFSQEQFDRQQEKTLEKIKWFRGKVEHYYMCHSPGRWKYRLTAIPEVVKGWFE